MKIHAYGDSWTAGEGSVKDKQEWKNYSWVKHLSDLLNVEHINNGISGWSNLKIFNKLVNDLKEGKIDENDIVIVMWSSSLRDIVPFLPNNEWVSWSVKHLLEFPEKFFDSYKSYDDKYDDFLHSFKEYYVMNLFNQNYYNIVNQNYIIFLQKMFEFYEIKYVMCDSFESMLIDLNKQDDKTKLIDQNHYWQFNKQTFRDFLNKLNRKDIWEHQDNNYKHRPTQHPNSEGYKIIAKELQTFMKYTIPDIH